MDAGRTWGYPGDDLPETTSAVVTVSQARVVGGTEAAVGSSVVYVELMNGAGAPLDEFRNALPEGASVVFYLSPGAEEGDADDPLDPAAGRPAGDRLWVPVGPQGFAIEDSERHAVVWPMALQAIEGTIIDAAPGGTVLPD